ncbi:hypothetical protein [Rhodococcus gordoniae]|uniref:hypothetical protein n=1 Tax=Rhodococcus gordoniae TaxID=223392 RepID=UPI0020CDE246|nr:hypothetical protein [Rhodococcus gordoniae]UTT50972.1 hypothetical protein NMQ04_21795 [Rhodococcus gordoniae]
MEFYSLVLPRSGLSIQWREDDMMRIDPASTIENEYWSPVSVMYTTDPESFPHEIKQQVWPGDSPDPTWWLVIGALNTPTAAAAQLADGTAVPVHRLGPLVLCEWTSTPQRLTLTLGSVTHTLAPFRAPSRGPAPYPYPRSDTPGGEGGWADFPRLE